MKNGSELLHGTLDLMILELLTEGELHGWAIAHRIKELSDDLLQVGQGSLYPALYRLRDMGLIQSEWGISEAGRRAKFYNITETGKVQRQRQREAWDDFSWAVNRVIGVSS